MLIEELARNASVRNQIDVILLDFSEAFDKVNHSELLWKLHMYGIRGQVLSWSKAFLKSRSQRVVIDGEESDSMPILFLVYINDLSGGVCSQVCLFADDTALYLIVENNEDSSTLQNDPDILSTWETRWDMEFYPSKCQVLQMTGSRRPLKTTYRSHG